MAPFLPAVGAIATGIATAITAIGARLTLKLNVVIAYGVVSVITLGIFSALFITLFNVVSVVITYIKQILGSITLNDADFGQFGTYVVNFLNCSGLSAGLQAYFETVTGSLQTMLLLLAGAIMLTVLRIVRDHIADVGKML